MLKINTTTTNFITCSNTCSNIPTAIGTTENRKDTKLSYGIGSKYYLINLLFGISRKNKLDLGHLWKTNRPT